MSRIITVTSGKGGVGKSSISVNLAIALAHQNLKVCLIDGDFGLKNLDVMMGLEDVVLSIPAVVDANGIETVVPIELSEKELAQLKSSAEILKKIIKENS